MIKNKIISLFLFLVFIFNNFNFISQAKDKLVIGLDTTFAPIGYVDENGEVIESGKSVDIFENPHTDRLKQFLSIKL